MFKLLAGFVLLCGYFIAGKFIVFWTSFPLPAALIGLLLLFATFMLLGKVPASIQSASQALLAHMSILFVPSTLAILILHEQLADHVTVIVTALIVSTLLSLAVTGWLAQRLMVNESDE